MNVERLTKLAEWLEAGAKHETITFDMTTGFTLRKVIDFDPKASMQCGSSCCIAGAAVQFFNNPEELIIRSIDGNYISNIDGINTEQDVPWIMVRNEARDILDLSSTQATDLFAPAHSENVRRRGDNRPGGPEIFSNGDWLGNYNDPAWAARTIRHLIATGRADWDATEEK